MEVPARHRGVLVPGDALQDVERDALSAIHVSAVWRSPRRTSPTSPNWVTTWSHLVA